MRRVSEWRWFYILLTSKSSLAVRRGGIELFSQVVMVMTTVEKMTEKKQKIETDKKDASQIPESRRHTLFASCGSVNAPLITIATGAYYFH